MVPMTTVASAGAYLLSAPVALGPNESVGKLPTSSFVRGYAYDESIICGWPIPRCRRVSQSTSHYLATMTHGSAMSRWRSSKRPSSTTPTRSTCCIPSRGIGAILSLVLLYELHDIQRFPRVQEFVSYCRLVKCAKESAGKRYGTSGTKIANAVLKWAFPEAAVLFRRANPAAQEYLGRLEKKHGKGNALTVLAHKLARAVYYPLQRHPAFDMHKFCTGSWRGAGERGA
jgi:hypothetical protein